MNVSSLPFFLYLVTSIVARVNLLIAIVTGLIKENK